mmetsp:Transcript_81784/g.217041  ORF Transcript_81784/g.217041 Transcript_81784/m.217041 type:complete len:288 (-) Transcript_81784:285-1148(-)
MALVRCGLQLSSLFAILEDCDLALDQDVEVEASLALLEDLLAGGEAHLHERPGKLHLLIQQQRLQHGNTVQALDVLLLCLLRRVGECSLEVCSMNDPDDGVRLGLDGRRAGRAVQQGELAKAAPGAHVAGGGVVARHGHALQGAGAPVPQHLEAAALHYVEVLGTQVALRDERHAHGHLLPPSQVHHHGYAVVVQLDHRVEVAVLHQRLSHELPLLLGLRAGRLHRAQVVRPAPDGPALRELELLMEPQRVELLAGDLEGHHLGGRGDGRRTRLVPQERGFAEVVSR